MEIATIGFTQSSAESFFERLRAAGIRRIVDTRLHNTSQLAGFAKGRDLEYFARTVLDGASYVHDLRLAPTDELLSAYKKGKKSWQWYEGEFRRLMAARGIPGVLDPSEFLEKTVLLCSEAKPDRCHRRIVAEILAEAWSAEVQHL